MFFTVVCFMSYGAPNKKWSGRQGRMHRFRVMVISTSRLRSNFSGSLATAYFWQSISAPQAARITRKEFFFAASSGEFTPERLNTV
jgi:hypothetical protein